MPGFESSFASDPQAPEDLANSLVENLYANLSAQSPALNPPHELT